MTYKLNLNAFKNCKETLRSKESDWFENKFFLSLMGGCALFALYILFFLKNSILVLIPIPFRGSKVVIYFFYFFNQYQVGPMALLNNMNSLNSLLQVAWYWDIYIYIFFFCLLCRGAKMVFQVILVKKLA